MPRALRHTSHTDIAMAMYSAIQTGGMSQVGGMPAGFFSALHHAGSLAGE